MHGYTHILPKVIRIISVSYTHLQARLDELMDIQQGISAELSAAKIGQQMKVIIDRIEGDYYLSLIHISGTQLSISNQIGEVSGNLSTEINIPQTFQKRRYPNIIAAQITYQKTDATTVGGKLGKFPVYIRILRTRKLLKRYIPRKPELAVVGRNLQMRAGELVDRSF